MTKSILVRTIGVATVLSVALSLTIAVSSYVRTTWEQFRLQQMRYQASVEWNENTIIWIATTRAAIDRALNEGDFEGCRGAREIYNAVVVEYQEVSMRSLGGSEYASAWETLPRELVENPCLKIPHYRPF